MAEIHPALQPGNVAVVTGGADGIGFAVARRLKNMGMRVCIADRDAGRLGEAATAIGADLFLATDVASRDSVTALADTVARKLGPVAFLMNNAGRGGGGDALSNPDGWDAVLGTNLFGVVHGVQAFAPAMVQGGAPGIIVNTGSKQGITQPPGDTAYNVSKSGVKALTEGLAHTLRNTDGCRVTAHLLIPGFTYTGMTRRYFDEKPDAAWTADQVADRMFAGIAASDFYLWCEDNETTRAIDEKRIAWTAGDMIENRPALSRWHPEWKDRFDRFMQE